MGLAVVRSLDAPRRLQSEVEVQEFEQELVDQYALAMAGSGTTDGEVSRHRRVVFEFIRFVGRPVWTAQPADADRYLTDLRMERSQSRLTVRGRP